jgi:Zn-dependent protease
VRGIAKWSPRIGRVAGIPIHVHSTFAVLLLFLSWQAGRRTGFNGAVAETVFVLILFACVALHEIGHSVVARASSVSVEGIVLYPFGGIAILSGPPPAGATEARIAVAGPLVNLSLAAVLLIFLGQRVAGPFLPGARLANLPESLFWANLVLGLFNLVPALPLDGGRALRGFLAGAVGHVKATRITGSIGQILGILLLVWGLAYNPWLGLIGLIVVLGATGELQRIQPMLILERQRVGDLVKRQIEVVTPDATLEGLRSFSQEHPGTDFAVGTAGAVTGYLPAASVWRAQYRTPGPPLEARALMKKLARPILLTAPLSEASEQMKRDGAEAAAVLDEAGNLVGIITAARIERSLALLNAITNRRSSGSGTRHPDPSDPSDQDPQD